MTLDTIMVLIAVTAMFATLAVVLGWTGKEVDWRASKKQAAAALPPPSPSSSAALRDCRR